MTPPPIADIVATLSPTGRRGLLAFADDPWADVHPASREALLGKGLIQEAPTEGLALRKGYIPTNLGRQVVHHLEGL